MRDDEKKVKITWDDLDKAEDNNPISMQPPENSSWGTISDSPLPVAEETISGGSIFLKSWFYLGAAGLLGAFLPGRFVNHLSGTNLIDTDGGIFGFFH